jgi:hypothetical protein
MTTEARPGRSAAQRRRDEWVRQNLAAVAGHGQELYDEDVNALPAAHRSAALEIAHHAIGIHESGDQADALDYAREKFSELVDRIGNAWHPPTSERPDPDLLDQIRGVRI